jgi:ribonuclease HII
VLCEVDEQGARALARPLPRSIRADLDDSKRLMSHSNYALGEAWARALTGTSPSTPEALLDQLLLAGREVLTAPCPSHVRAQCWGVSGEAFLADDELCARIRRQRAALEKRGIKLLAVKTSWLCTKHLNDQRERRLNRFTVDLHAMEALVLALREAAGAPVHATCGKVGGIGSYEKFFGPLSGRLRTVLEEGQKKSAYFFPGIGELSFVRDADADNPLVSLASLVGKYVRELSMARITRFYPSRSDDDSASGYHDPVTQAFVERTALSRRRKKVPSTCFERAREPLLDGDELARQPPS